MNSQVQTKFDQYPPQAKAQLEEIRGTVFSVAESLQLGSVEESLKWGEPSYRVKGGSPIRIDWKPDAPDVVKVFFNCQTRLVETFREIYSGEFTFEGNRALVVPLGVEFNDGALKHCLELAMKYHSLKNLPLLGV